MSTISFADHFEISQTALDELGVYNPLLNADSRLFIDPKLVRASQIPEFQNASELIDEYYEDLFVLVSNITGEHDVFRRQAKNKLTFPEFPLICMGYAPGDTRGSGIGSGIVDRVIDNAISIIRAGINNPRVFELVGLYEENIGADRVSDMIASIIAPCLIRYTERILRQLGVETAPFVYKRLAMNTIENPYSGLPILLVPVEIIRDLPIATSWGEISHFVDFNRELREEMNQRVGAQWMAIFDRRLRKEDRVATILNNPSLLIPILRAYDEMQGNSYDLVNDPRGERRWYDVAKEITRSDPFDFTLARQDTVDWLVSFVSGVCDQFRRLVERRGLNTYFYTESGKTKPERAFQLLFFGVADCYCRIFDVDVNRESATGRGNIDIKFSNGYRQKVVVEIKKSDNSRLEHGYLMQIQTYLDSEETQNGYYVIIEVPANSETDHVRKFMEGTIVQRREHPNIRVEIVDGRPRPTASLLD